MPQMDEQPDVQIRLGDCREIIATLPDCSIDSIVTDPPYELGFMGKKWDATGIAYDLTLWEQCLRVLKPGGHLLAFGGTRTYHRMTCAIEDAGFEIRDCIVWLYGSGFPKSHDVSKAIDKAAGAEREVVGVNTMVNVYRNHGPFDALEEGDIYEKSPITAPATDAAKQWAGWGTALKPAHEPIVVARKPLIGTVAANVQQPGTGALNIDGTRVPGPIEGDPNRFAETDGASFVQGGFTTPPVVYSGGRWPANVITDGSIETEWVRYFYVAKPSKRERDAGIRNLEHTSVPTLEGALADVEKMDDLSKKFLSKPRANHHPTVKPLALMRYLVRLITPPGGTVLEPFAGSGTTIMAAVMEGCNAIGCELTAEYLPIIEGRVAWAREQYAAAQPTLFGETHG